MGVLVSMDSFRLTSWTRLSPSSSTSSISSLVLLPNLGRDYTTMVSPAVTWASILRKILELGLYSAYAFPLFHNYFGDTPNSPEEELEGGFN